jgi:hypothetical protein
MAGHCYDDLYPCSGVCVINPNKKEYEKCIIIGKILTELLPSLEESPEIKRLPELKIHQDIYLFNNHFSPEELYDYPKIFFPYFLNQDLGNFSVIAGDQTILGLYYFLHNYELLPSIYGMWNYEDTDAVICHSSKFHSCQNF